MNDTGRVRENITNSRNTGEGISHNSVRAQARERQAARERSSMSNEHSDLGESSSRSQGEHLAEADHTGINFSRVMEIMEQYISKNDREEWKKQRCENLERLNEHKRKYGNYFKKSLNERIIGLANAREFDHCEKKSVLDVVRYINDCCYLKDNWKKSQSDKDLWLKQIRERNTQECQALERFLGQITFKGPPTPEQLQQLLGFLDDRQKRRREQSTKKWGEVTKGWAERYYQMTGSLLMLSHDSDG